jgi:hypothetical protein
MSREELNGLTLTSQNEHASSWSMVSRGRGNYWTYEQFMAQMEDTVANADVKYLKKKEAGVGF